MYPTSMDTNGYKEVSTNVLNSLNFPGFIEYRCKYGTLMILNIRFLLFLKISDQIVVVRLSKIHKR